MQFFSFFVKHAVKASESAMLLFQLFKILVIDLKLKVYLSPKIHGYDLVFLNFWELSSLSPLFMLPSVLLL